MLVLLATAVIAFDCDELKEPERTHCLDRAAQDHVRMMPLHDHLKVADTKDPVEGFQDDSVDDIMGDLGESSKTQVKMDARAQMKAQLRLAERETDGMYDDDVRVAKAFSDLDDEMDDLKTHLGQLHTNMEVAESENRVRHQFEREDDMERASREELGESESSRSDGTVHQIKDSSDDVLHASASDLEKDLTVNYHGDHAPDTEDKVDFLMNKLRSISGSSSPTKKAASVLDDSVAFVQFDSASLDDGVTDDIVMQDLQSSGASLMDRASVEAKQADSMDNDTEELQDEANDLGEVDKEEEDASKNLDALDEVFADKPSLDADMTTQKEEAGEVVSEDEHNRKPEKPQHGIGVLARDNVEKEAMAFTSEEDNKEEQEIKQAAQREKKMEEQAKSKMYLEMKKMNAQVSKEQEKLESTMRKHKKEESRKVVV